MGSIHRGPSELSTEVGILLLSEEQHFPLVQRRRGDEDDAIVLLCPYARALDHQANTALELIDCDILVWSAR